MTVVTLEPSNTVVVNADDSVSVLSVGIQGPQGIQGATGPMPSLPGSSTQVIFNDGGVFGADSGLVFDKATDALTVAGRVVVGSGSAARRTTYDAYRFLYNMNDAAFRKWRLAYAKQRVGTKIATITFIGDSITAGQTVLVSDYWLNSFPGQIRTYFNSLTGVDSGTGIIKTTLALTEIMPSPAAGAHVITTVRTGVWTNFGGVGFFDCYSSNQVGNTISFSWTGPEKIRIYTYRGLAGLFGGTHTSTIDGVASATISNASPQAFIATDFTPIGNGAHTVELTVQSGGRLTVCGVALRPASDATPGVVVNNGGWSSSESSRFLGTSDAFQTFSLPAAHLLLAPDLTVIMLGTVDMVNAVSPATYKSNMQAIITASKLTGDVLLMVPPRDSSGGVNNFSAFIDALYELADSNAVPLFDLRRRFETQENAYTDSIGHMNLTGASDTAAAIKRILQVE